MHLHYLGLELGHLGQFQSHSSPKCTFNIKRLCCKSVYHCYDVGAMRGERLGQETRD